ncbi:D-isomer specific 2-hydroxyacid dehydrogenase NAD-binding protein [mine drainage metagenome]|uniref:D-isomer specific 2-hydroxyacid dehydrogenase NAD-binding protein n=1 Tax=mine drainage metagenome TaxID=410659 RepID=T1AAS7_9ZZZZ
MENGNISNSVNFPPAHLARLPGSARLAVANRNVPNVVGQICTRLAAAGLNVAGLLNASRGDYAYTLLDMEGACGDDLLGAVRAIHGVLSAYRV